jgi:hypothetical protein
MQVYILPLNKKFTRGIPPGINQLAKDDAIKFLQQHIDIWGANLTDQSFVSCVIWNDYTMFYLYFNLGNWGIDRVRTNDSIVLKFFKYWACVSLCDTQKYRQTNLSKLVPRLNTWDIANDTGMYLLYHLVRETSRARILSDRPPKNLININLATGEIYGN